MKRIKDHKVEGQHVVGLGVVASRDGFSREAAEKLEVGQPVVLVSDRLSRDVRAYGVDNSWGYLGAHYRPSYFISKSEYEEKQRKFVRKAPRFGYP